MSEFYGNEISTIFFAVCSYDGNIHYKTMLSLLNCFTIVDHTTDLNYLFSVKTGSHINRLRNELVHEFLKSDADYIFFIDADVYGFEKIFERLVSSREQVIGGVYPIKQLHNDLLNLNIHQQKPLFETSTLFNVNLKSSDVENLEINNGIIEVKHLATGCLMIRRDVFEILKARVQSYNEVYNFFHSYVYKEKYLTEDYGFCQYCITNNIKIKAIIDEPLYHVGQFTYYGNYKDFLDKYLLIKKIKSNSN